MADPQRLAPRIAFVRTGPLNLTPAVERNVNFLRAGGYRGEIVGLELDFQANRPAVSFVDALDSQTASYRNTAERIWMMARWQLFQLRRLLRRRPDVVQFCDVFSALPALVIKWTRGAKLIYDVRDPARLTLRHRSRLGSAVLGWLEEFTAARSDVVIQVSEPLKALLKGDIQARTVVIPNAPLEDAFSSFAFSTDGKLRVSLAGFISHGRNLAAWCELARKDAGVVLDLYGAVYEDRTRRILSRFGIPEPKSLPQGEAIARMAASDVVSIMYDPSLEVNRYTAPNKFYDALMLGKPVICAEGLLLAQEIARVQCGLAVPYGDSEALARAMALLRDLRTRRRMGEAARQHFLNHYHGAPARARGEVYRRAGLRQA
jgi:glycosyltransferase involved in cell wall biosynthesis